MSDRRTSARSFFPALQHGNNSPSRDASTSRGEFRCRKACAASGILAFRCRPKGPLPPPPRMRAPREYQHSAGHHHGTLRVQSRELRQHHRICIYHDSTSQLPRTKSCKCVSPCPAWPRNQTMLLIAGTNLRVPNIWLEALTLIIGTF